MTPEQIADIRARFVESAGTSDDTLAIIALLGEVERLQALVAKIQVQVDYWFAHDELTHADGIMENIAFYLEGRDLPKETSHEGRQEEPDPAAPQPPPTSLDGRVPVTSAMLDFARYRYRIGLPESDEEWLGARGWYPCSTICYDDTLVRRRIDAK